MVAQPVYLMAPLPRRALRLLIHCIATQSSTKAKMMTPNKIHLPYNNPRQSTIFRKNKNSKQEIIYLFPILITSLIVRLIHNRHLVVSHNIIMMTAANRNNSRRVKIRALCDLRNCTSHYYSSTGIHIQIVSSPSLLF